MEFVEFRCAEFTISNYPLVSSGRSLPAERCTILPGRVRPDDRDQVGIDLSNIQGCEIFENAKISKANEFSMAANGVFWKMNYYSYFTAEVLNVQYFVR